MRKLLLAILAISYLIFLMWAVGCTRDKTSPSEPASPTSQTSHSNLERSTAGYTYCQTKACIDTALTNAVSGDTIYVDRDTFVWYDSDWPDATLYDFSNISLTIMAWDTTAVFEVRGGPSGATFMTFTNCDVRIEGIKFVFDGDSTSANILNIHTANNIDFENVVIDAGSDNEIYLEADNVTIDECNFRAGDMIFYLRSENNHSYSHEITNSYFTDNLADAGNTDIITIQMRGTGDITFNNCYFSSRDEGLFSIDMIREYETLTLDLFYNHFFDYTLGYSIALTGTQVDITYDENTQSADHCGDSTAVAATLVCTDCSTKPTITVDIQDWYDDENHFPLGPITNISSERVCNDVTIDWDLDFTSSSSKINWGTSCGSLTNEESVTYNTTSHSFSVPGGTGTVYYQIESKVDGCADSTSVLSSCNSVVKDDLEITGDITATYSPLECTMTIEWDTNGKSSSRVKLYNTNCASFTSNVDGANNVTHHSVEVDVSGYRVGSRVYFKVQSTDDCTTVTSSCQNKKKDVECIGQKK